ncbi:hypothetical protein SAMN05444008_1015 [Cnuella takakiae]|uniref:Uncharacterized protein n=1 Tax=Cnuella takakiae TaxID=1302690 RepID=A0A1M4S7Z8_9BACT|nr:hypothetical protein [Cnuella takakiae]OLY94406.1 hypothetical protein BUE76_22885 [Cnuella takakiae]SHE28295.1 hypothetical protein SAMN05444008_1015 [Cnuella takakiae]
MDSIKYQVGSWLKNREQNAVNSDIDQRLTLLEEKVFKKLKGLRATDAQRFLLFHYMKGLEPIIQRSDISQNQKDLLVSLIINIDQDNAKKFLAELGKKVKPKLETETNYNFLVQQFASLGLSDLEAKAEIILTKIRAEKEK